MLKDEIICYRNNNPEYRTLLGTVIGELDRITKNPTDEQVVRVIKKMIEDNCEIDSLESKEENFVLSKFLPSQLSENQIKDIILEQQFKSIKDCMQYFKDNYIGKYDGKLVSKLYNNK